MASKTFKVYPYRWVVLLAFMFVVVANQLLWISFAPVTRAAADFYGVSTLSIGILSLSFLAVYILVSFPASWVIDTKGIRVAVGIGAVLTGVFGLLRGLAGSNYTLALLAQIAIAIGQPFILNAITTVAARWFPLEERATASGLGSLAAYLGILVGLVLTPFLVLQLGMQPMLMIYGVVSLLPVLTFFLFVKECPVTPPCPPEMEVRSLVLDGYKDALRNKNFLFLLVIFFVGLGAFNAVTTWIEEMLGPRGFSATQAGITGGLMIAGGILGALILPSLSDRFHKRIPFIITAVLGATIGLVGVTYSGSYTFLLIFAFILGFFLLSAGPIGFQYAAEVTYPAPEGTSNGLLLLMGQVSGIVFILGMDALKSPANGSMTLSLNGLIALMLIGLILCFRLKEPPALQSNEKR